MNQICKLNKLRNLISKSNSFFIVRKYNIGNIKNVLRKTVKPIFLGASLFGFSYISYILINKKTSTEAESSISNFFSDPPKIIPEFIVPENLKKEEKTTRDIQSDFPVENAEETKINENKSNSLVFQSEFEVDIVNGLPTKVPYVIIGAGIAGMSAARSIRASDPFAKVLIINSECQSPGEHKDTYPPYRRILLSKFIWRRPEEQQKSMLITDGDVKSSSLLYIEPDSFFVPLENLNKLKYGGISLLNGTKVASIDPSESSLTLEGSDHKIMYKACLIATGSYPRRLMQLEVATNTEKNLYQDGKVSYFRSLNDYRNLFENIKRLQMKETGGRILIVGGGLLGTELTTSLSRLSNEKAKLEVVEVFKERSNLYNLLPEELSKYISQFISKNNATKLIARSEVISIGEVTEGVDIGKLDISIRPLSASDDSEVIKERVDHVIIAAGVKPDVSLATSSNLELDQLLDGFLVNSELQAREGVFVAGDACSFYDPTLGCRRRVEHWDHSEESGNIAGHNMASFVLNTCSQDSLARIDRLILATDILRPKIYDFQSSFSFKMSMSKMIEALGVVDSSLETRTFIVDDFYEEVNFEEADAADGGKALPVKDKEVRRTRDKLDMPGVVFYLRGRRVVGVVLWNCDDDIIIDTDFPSPLRSNVARKMLSEQKSQRSDEELRLWAADFDLSFFVNSQVKFLDEYTRRMKDKEDRDTSKDQQPQKQ